MSEIIKISGRDLFVRQQKNSATLEDNVLITSQITNENITASDNYHTFEELYDHRITLFIALCRLLNTNSLSERMFKKTDESSELTLPRPWKSKINGDGSVWEGWFILGINKEPGKQITYHLPLSRWEETDFVETLDQAPEFDGHTSADVLERLKQL